MPPTRRAFLKTTLGALAAACLPARADDSASLTIDLHAATDLGPIAPDFIGLGYETSAVAMPGFFSPKNFQYLQLVRSLGAQGLFRIGGNISDWTRWSPQGQLASLPQPQTTIINEQAIADLAGFVRATGWKVMWGLNLGSGPAEEAVAEAVAVSKALGDRLHSFEIGNEVDLLANGHHLANWNFAAYHAKYLEYKTAIRAALPDAPFSGPDAAFKVDWCQSFAEAEGRDLKALTLHYYRGGAKEPRSTLEYLLQSDTGFGAHLEKMKVLSQAAGVPYRINETNSFSGGGKEGVSDVFGAALWCLDYLFFLASHGSGGVNIETDYNQYHWVSKYSPIFHDTTGPYTARPTYYGMLAFAMAGKGRLLQVAVPDSPINFRAYATQEPTGSSWLVVINKDLKQDLRISITLPTDQPHAELHRLTAPSVTAQTGLTLAGTQVARDGTWSPGPPEKIALRNRTADLSVPRASAALLHYTATA